MRPLYLVIHSFGPFAGQEVIDFTRLRQHSLFLIYGPTGSGKTTILDAMCYALYGTTSGDSRTGAHMRSEYASPAEETRVSFTFAIGEKTYRIERSPEQEIAKKRGQGTKKASAKAVLYAIDAAGEKPLATKNVTRAVEALLGFRADQFRQVVLLPQGEFRRLLLSSSSERQQIMQTLFHTQRYANLQELAKRHRDEITRRYAGLKDEREQLLEALTLTTESELPAKEQKWQEELNQSEAAEKKATLWQQECQTEKEKAQVLASYYATGKAAQQRAVTLQQAAPLYQEKRQEVERLRQVQVLAEPCRHLDEIEAAGKNSRQVLEQLLAQNLVWEKELAQAKEQAALLKKSAALQDEDQRELITLQSFQEKAENYAALKKKARQYQTDSRHLRSIWQADEKQKEVAKRKLQELQSQVEKVPDLLKKASAVNTQIQHLSERLRREIEAEDLQGKLQDSQAQIAVWQEQKENLAEKARRQRVAYEAVRTIFLQAQAAILSSQLKHGQPCPVCGSREHPSPAIPPASLPGKEDVEREKRKAEAAENDYHQVEVQVKTGEEKVKGLRQQYLTLRRQFPVAGSSRDWQERLEKEKKEAEKLAQQLTIGEVLQKQVKKQEASCAVLEQKVETSRKESEKARERQIQVEAALQRLEADLPEKYRQPQALTKRLSLLQERVNTYAEKVEKTTQQILEKEKQVARGQQEKSSQRQRVEELRQRYQEEMRILQERVQVSGFSSVKECRQRQKELPRLPLLEKEIRDYDSKVQQTQGLLEEAKKAIQGRPEPELSHYEAAWREAEAQRQKLAEETAKLRFQYEQWQGNAQKLLTFQAKAKSLTQAYQTIGGIYELIAGKQTGVNLERYVLGALLDEVLQAANTRLQAMSRQRYLLQRSHTREDKRIKQVGLDIEVFDNYTGYARPANTLSGGETFLASLSLALGLADVVQAYAGGIHLDTIFIDEGFGTLDGETLDYALKTLVSLQSGGRLVGIISHVAELRERIDARLAVTRIKRGSTTHFEFD